PDLTINSYTSKVWNDANSDFVSVHATTIQETAATKRLLSLLIKQKESIDEVLDSQPVYALGPDFQQGYSVPCIACWVAEPLDITLIERLSALFDNEFEIINYVVEKPRESLNDGEEQDIELSSNDAKIINKDEYGGESKNKDIAERNEKDEGNKNEDEDSNKSRDGNESGKDESNGKNESNEMNKSDPFIQVKSVANVKVDNEIQSFTINTYIGANISTKKNVSKNCLEFGINLFLCGAGEMLSKICGSLQGFTGYYLDSISIAVSPIPHAVNIFDEAKAYSPTNHDQKIELLAGHETSSGGQIGLTTPHSLSITANIAKKNSHSTKATVNKWNMEIYPCSTKGVKWSYNFNSYNLKETDIYREWPNPQPHLGYWYTKDKMKGFQITIIQTLRCKFKYNFFRRVKPEIIKKCPKIDHKLEISFNDLTDFNNGFKKLTKKLHSEHNDIIVDLKDNSSFPISIKKTNEEMVFQQKDYMSLNRVLSLEKK
ncbi:18185_t:CDS:2, partial [Dentiscutata erythropus]